MLNVYLLRHGETFYNADGNRYCGRTDIGLTAKGRSQAEAVASQLEGIKIDAVYSSPLIRARVTAEIASRNRTVQVDQRLIEVDFGEWEGKTRNEFVARDPALWNAWVEDPSEARAGGSGETGKEIIERLDGFYDEMLQTHHNGSILVVGHNGTNRLYMAFKLGMEIRNYRRIVQENSSITHFSLDDAGEFSLLKLNARY